MLRHISLYIIPTTKGVFALIPLVLLATGAAEASGTVVRVIPEAVYPGDVFLVEVESVTEPSAEFDGRPIRFYPLSSGLYRAVGSVGLDIDPGDHPLSLTVGTRRFRYKITVQEKKFQVRRLTLAPEKVFLSPEDRERVRREDIRLSALWRRLTGPLWDGRFVPPVDTPLTTPFGVVRIMNGKKRSRHRGVDYRAEEGQPVRAVNSGVVVLADELFYGGRTLVVDHGAGIYSVYMHLSRFDVGVGEGVRKGEVIGRAGATGRATGPHLHLSIKVGERSVNPESIFSLPLSGKRGPEGRNPSVY